MNSLLIIRLFVSTTMNKDFCKVLIISNSILNEDNATSITLKNMFSGWPVDKLAIIYTSLDKNISNSIYPVFHVSELKYLANKTNSSNVLLNNIRSSRGEVKGVQGTAGDSSLKSRIFNYIHTIASSYKAMFPYKYSNELEKFVSEFNPDVIYSILSSIAAMDITLRLSNKFKIPIVPHFMDDWPHTIYENDILLFLPRLKKKYFLKKVLKNTRTGIAISDKMAKEYNSEYHKEFYSLMNCVSLPDSNEGIEIAKNNKKIEFSYFGGLHLLRWQTLKTFFESLEINARYSMDNFEFRIYAPESDRIRYENQFAQLSSVLFCDRVSQSALFSEMIKSDYLIHVEAFDEKMKKYTRLSISTKIPEYLVIQKPIVAIGPADVASIEYLRDNKCAHVISDLDSTAISATLENLFSTEFNRELLKNALQLFLKNHNTKMQHQLLQSIFYQNCNNPI